MVVYHDHGNGGCERCAPFRLEISWKLTVHYLEFKSTSGSGNSRFFFAWHVINITAIPQLLLVDLYVFIFLSVKHFNSIT